MVTTKSSRDSVTAVRKPAKIPGSEIGTITLSKDLPLPGTQIPGGLNDGVIELFQPGENNEQHKGHAEGDVGQQYGAEAQFHVQHR